MLLNVYNRFNVSFVKGKGVYLYDDQGNEIQLNTGKTYIAVAQDGRDVRFQ